MKINPKLIQGRWRTGYALDLHTISSEFLGHDEYGHAKFDNKRSEVGELLFKLKYGSESKYADSIADTAVNFIKGWNPKIDLILPVPPTKARTVQPVILVAQGISKKLGIKLAENAIKKVADTPQLKDVSDYDERIKILKGAYKVDKDVTKGKRILLFDDLYRSGATMNVITELLYEAGAADVFALTITRTRSNS